MSRSVMVLDWSVIRDMLRLPKDLRLVAVRSQGAKVRGTVEFLVEGTTVETAMGEVEPRVTPVFTVHSLDGLKITKFEGFRRTEA